MRVLISVDMEGVAGIATLDQVIRGGSGYHAARELMTNEANAAIEGAFSGGATEVLVDDSHGTMDNLVQDRLDARARLVLGAPRAQCMVHGVDESTSVALFVGYHGPAGGHGVLAHTFSINFTALRLNGIAQSEMSVNQLICAAYGVPVGLVTGDDVTCELARTAMPQAGVVEVKTAEGFAASTSLHPEASCVLIRSAAEKALRDASALARPAALEELFLEIDFPTPLHADYVSLMTDFARSSAIGVSARIQDARCLGRAISAAYYLASIAAAQVAGIARRR